MYYILLNLIFSDSSQVHEESNPVSSELESILSSSQISSKKKRSRRNCDMSENPSFNKQTKQVTITEPSIENYRETFLEEIEKELLNNDTVKDIINSDQKSVNKQIMPNTPCDSPIIIEKTIEKTMKHKVEVFVNSLPGTPTLENILNIFDDADDDIKKLLLSESAIVRNTSSSPPIPLPYKSLTSSKPTVDDIYDTVDSALPKNNTNDEYDDGFILQSIEEEDREIPNPNNCDSSNAEEIIVESPPLS